MASQDSPTTKNLTQTSIQLFSTGVALAFSKTASAPIERVQLLLQTQVVNDKITNRYTGIFNCLQRIPKEEGFAAFWRGNATDIIRSVSSRACQIASFPIKSSLDRAFGPVDKTTPRTRLTLQSLLVGGIAGIIPPLLTYPLFFARVRLACDVGKPETRQFKGITDCLSRAYKTDGLRGWYKGASLSVLGVFIYRAFYFGLYDIGTALLMKPEESLLKRFAFAQAVVLGSGAVTYPVDTMRKVLMMRVGREEAVRVGIVDMCRNVYQAGGLKAFWRGFLITPMTSLGGSFMLVLYDEVKRAV